MTTPIKSLSREQIKQAILNLGQPKFRAGQIIEWLYKKGASSYDEMTNLPKNLRDQLSEEYPLISPSILDIQKSKDGTRKYLLGFPDGTRIETVGIPSKSGRLTVCCSSQAGCAMACAFCATGRNGFTRNLLIGEIVDQILIVQNDFGERVTNVVVMGQGEPFLNFDNLIEALRIMNDSKLLDIGARHITVSTCGIIPGIDRFAGIPEQFTLAVSLHSAIQSTRNELMPGVKGYPLTKLKRSIQSYINKSGRRISFEYALMDGINSTDEDLAALESFCQDVKCHVNLIPLNEVDGSIFKPVSNDKMNYWCNTLIKDGINSSIRLSKGSDIDGACGQLANSYTNTL